MRKRDELTNPNGCMFRACDDEMTFVLLGRDAAAPAAIRAWCEERIRLGKNVATDPQIVEAMSCAATMERERTASATEVVNRRWLPLPDSNGHYVYLDGSRIFPAGDTCKNGVAIAGLAKTLQHQPKGWCGHWADKFPLKDEESGRERVSRFDSPEDVAEALFRAGEGPARQQTPHTLLAEPLTH